MAQKTYTTNPGDLIAIMITGETKNYIAEVVEHNPDAKYPQYPLVLKVEESGLFSRLRGEDFIIWERETAILQNDADDEAQQQLLSIAANNGSPWQSGIYKLNCTDGKMKSILPVT